MAEYLAEITEGLIRLFVAGVAIHLHYKSGRFPRDANPIWILVGCGFLLWGAIGISSGVMRMRSSHQDIDVTTEAGLKSMAAAMATGCPREIDPETELMTVTAERGVLLLHIRLLNTEAAGLDLEGFQRGARASLVEKACTTEMRDSLLLKGVTLSYQYVDAVREPVAQIDINSSDCVTRIE